MLCVNCDQPIPEGHEACPSCGAHRLELLAAPASAMPASPFVPTPIAVHAGRPRRRRGGAWGVVLLLLALAVAAALAGQAIQSRNASAASAPPAGGHGKAQDVVRVALGAVPDGVPDPGGAVDAVRAAMKDWGSQGAAMQEAGGNADVAVQFVQDAGQAPSSGPGTAVVPLGDRSCGGAWMAYDQASVRALAARALGQAMGRDGPAGPGELMDAQLQPRYAQPCGGSAGTQGSLAIPDGHADGKAFTLAAPATVNYTMQVTGGSADVCLLTPSQWDAFAAGNGTGAACHFAVPSASDGAALDAGDYILGFRCVGSGSAGCQVDYTLSTPGG